MRKTSLLRKLIAEEGLLEIAGGCYDALTAMLAENAGFRAASISGSGVHASLLGLPDVGLLTLKELLEVAANIVQAVTIPVLADADQGSGGTIHIRRTMRAFETTGVAGLFIDDQEYPSRAAGKAIVPTEEMVTRIKAALAARQDPDFILCARTDADIVSMDEVIRRCNIYSSAGADLVMPYLPPPVNLKRFEELAAGVKVPMWFSATKTGVPIAELRRLGLRGLVTYSGGTTLLMATFHAVFSILDEIKKGGSGQATLTRLGAVDPAIFRRVIGLDALVTFETKFPEKR